MRPNFYLTPKLFLRLLVAASIVPYLIVMACGYTRPFGSLNLLEQLLIAVGFLNGVHVPATLYLYFDRDIRKQAKSTPFLLIYMPLFFIVASFALYSVALINDAVWAKYMLVTYLLAYIYWGAWHAGKQSYGVHSFATIITNRKRTVAQRNFEKNTIVWGTVFGLCSIYKVMPYNWWITSFPGVNYYYFDMMSSIAYYIGMVGCLMVAYLAIRHVIMERALFTFSGGILYLIGALFFLPGYFAAFIPDITPPNAVGTFINLQVVHGVQYSVFMLAHAAGRGEEKAMKFTGKPARKLFARLLPVLLLVAVAIFGLHSLNGGIILHEASTWITDMLQVNDQQLWILAAVMGISLGFQMAHFWVDSFIWRLSEPAPRAWMMSRYRQVLSAKA